MKKEYRRIKKLAKKHLTKKHLKQLRKIKDYTEKSEALKYLVTSNLKLKVMDIESKIPKKRTLILDAKLSQLHAKIKILESSHSKKDYELIKKSLDELTKEVEKCLDS